ncbi:succinate-semialdehyde dehydrogenase (NAD(P)(+)) [Starmerella bacillaris]|uniref:succinate-semialdehyde dehydrogenase [NAD(P)(+)] n=1 Tax=Starmerella bacillaris TaxID=1247836 RepID=A0AAV5RG92_STABA|nr:succinate-semialdehyde dehydrogenase (NAD(P)(+)) [Starmerella bacillaris]
MSSRLSLSNKELLLDSNLINGQWIRKADQFDVTDPANGNVISTVSNGTAEDAEKAVAAAHAAFKSFKRTTPRERSGLLKKWAQLVRENIDDLSHLVTLENGKPLAEAKGEVLQSALTFEWFSELCPHFGGVTIPSQDPTHRIHTLRQPAGVCGLITPWNFPAAMIARKVGAAVAAGCTTVLKPAKLTPLVALAMLKLGLDAGIPNGVLNVVTSSDHAAEIGTVLATDPRVSKISFTGSTAVGKILAKQATGTMKKVSMELGGNAPFIVFDDADVKAAVQGAIASKFRGSGQTCVCANRFYVQDGIYDAFVAEFKDAVNKQLKLGHGLDAGTTQGPLSSPSAMKKIEEHVEDALHTGGGKLIAGGKARSDIGPLFYEPTIIADVDPNAKVFNEETFGPLAAIARFNSEEEVIKQANNTEVGLASYFYTKDISRAHRVSEELESGMVGINTGIITEVSLPFGGIKESGYGRENSIFGLEDYTILKSVVTGI